ISRSSPVAGSAEAAPNRSLPARERQPVLPLTRLFTWSLGPEFVERAAPADRQRVLTLIPVVVGLNGRVPEVSQVRRHTDRQERLADALHVSGARDAVHFALQAGEAVLSVRKSQRQPVDHFNDKRSDGAVTDRALEPVAELRLKQQLVGDVPPEGWRDDGAFGCIHHEATLVDVDVADTCRDGSVKRRERQSLAGLAEAKREPFTAVTGSRQRRQRRSGVRR